MNLNLNFTHTADYNLNARLIKEAISMYGLECRLLLVDKLNVDETFGDYSGIKSDSEKIFDIHLLPENGESYENTEYAFGEFGYFNHDTTSGYVSTFELTPLGIGIKELFGSLVVLPSNKVMEVTSVDIATPGVNNLFAYSDKKSVYKLSMKTYEFRQSDELKSEDLINTMEISDDAFGFGEPESGELDLDSASANYDALDGFFGILADESKKVDEIAEVKDTAIVKEETPDENKDGRVKKPVVDTSVKDPFGW